MAFFGDLVRAVSAAEGMDETTVAGIGQYLRRAGLISKSGRGNSAARMTGRDAANLLIAVNGTGAAKDAVLAVERFAPLAQTGRIAGAGEPWSTVAAGSGTFGAALELLLDASRTDEGGSSALNRALEVTTAGALSASELKHLERSGTPLEPAFLEVEMSRPTWRAEIRTMVPYFHQAAGELFFHASFELAFSNGVNAGPASDRRDITIITERTLRSVADALRD